MTFGVTFGLSPIRLMMCTKCSLSAALIFSAFTGVCHSFCFGKNRMQVDDMRVWQVDGQHAHGCLMSQLCPRITFVFKSDLYTCGQTKASDYKRCFLSRTVLSLCMSVVAVN